VTVAYNPPIFIGPKAQRALVAREKARRRALGSIRRERALVGAMERPTQLIGCARARQFLGASHNLPLAMHSFAREA
jgi:hypothetical protein